MVEEQPTKVNRVQATFYLDREDVAALDQLQVRRNARTGKRTERSEIVREAIRLLVEKEKQEGKYE